MTIDLISTQDEFQALQEEWNALLEKSASHVPFLRHEYLTSWWSTLGGGEWDQGDLFILAERESQGELIGIAPFFHHQARIMLLGSHEISDFLDVLAPPEHLEPFLERIFDYLESDSPHSWQVLDLYNLLASSPTLPYLKNLAGEKGWTHSQSRIHPAPHLQLPGSWEAYLNGLESRYRHEIERKLRRAESYFLPVDWHIVNSEDNLEEELQDFLELMANHQEKAAFLTETMASQMRSTVRQAHQAGWLQLAFLTVGDLKAAGYLNFDFNNRIWVYNSGINPLFENLSPGWVLLAFLIQDAIQAGRDVLDFMRGDEAYKYHLGGVDRDVVRVEIVRE